MWNVSFRSCQSATFVLNRLFWHCQWGQTQQAMTCWSASLKGRTWRASPTTVPYLNKQMDLLTIYECTVIADYSFKCLPLDQGFSLMIVHNEPQWLSEKMYVYLNRFGSVKQLQCITECHKTVWIYWSNESGFKVRSDQKTTTFTFSITCKSCKSATVFYSEHNSKLTLLSYVDH